MAADRDGHDKEGLGNIAGGTRERPVVGTDSQTDGRKKEGRERERGCPHDYAGSTSRINKVSLCSKTSFVPFPVNNFRCHSSASFSHTYSRHSVTDRKWLGKKVPTFKPATGRRRGTEVAIRFMHTYLYCLYVPCINMQPNNFKT